MSGQPKRRDLHPAPLPPAAPMPGWRRIPPVLDDREKPRHPSTDRVNELLPSAPTDEREGEVDPYGQVHREGPPMLPRWW